MEIQKNPVNKAGEATTPPVWQMNCLEQVCGICTMIINGRARQSCSALVDKLDQPIKAGTDVEVSERSRPGRGSFADVRSSAQGARVDRVGRHLRSWTRAAHGPGRRAGTLRLFTLHDLWLLSGGVPQYEGDNYIGPQAIAQVRLFNMHPSGKMNREERLEGIMQEDGITNCGNAQNCVKACPMNIPLTRAIYEENRETVIHGLLGWLKG
jgi:succinate dehydrogenase / fumarate reductase iron-sulfur subunit